MIGIKAYGFKFLRKQVYHAPLAFVAPVYSNNRSQHFDFLPFSYSAYLNIYHGIIAQQIGICAEQRLNYIFEIFLCLDFRHTGKG